MNQPAGTGIGTKLEEQTSEELSQAPYLGISYAHPEVSHDNLKLAQLTHVTTEDFYNRTYLLYICCQDFDSKMFKDKIRVHNYSK